MKPKWGNARRRTLENNIDTSTSGIEINTTNANAQKKNDMDVGIDNVIEERLIYGCSLLVELLHYLFNVWKLNLPKDWEKNALLFPVQKERCKREFKNHEKLVY